MARLSALPTIHMFWYGAPLSRVERVCMASFVANGHALHLHVYDEPQHVPAGVQLMDASQILSRDLIFRHRRTGSVGLFADWFRYRLLYARGGIWADADVVCLKPFAFPDPVVFALQDYEYLNNAVFGVPPGHELAAWMAACCEDPNRILPYDSLSIRFRKWRRRYLQGNRRDRIRWGEYGPKGLTRAARHLGYFHKALPTQTFYPVPCDQWQLLFEDSAQARALSLEESYGVHLWNNMMGEVPGFDKNARFPADSPFEKLCRRFLRNGE